MSEPTSFFTIESVTINSSRQVEEVNITGLVSDITIYENMDMPFLTGELAFIDDKRLLERLDIVGGEFITITLTTKQGGEPLTKRFCVERLDNATKVNERSEAIILTLIEDIGFISNFKNVNRGYDGNPIDILNKISTDYLGVDTLYLHETVQFQRDMKMIVPNMHPIEAMMWIKNRLTDDAGYPAYLFSTLHLEGLKVGVLSDLIDQTPLNKRQPFIYGANASVGNDILIDKQNFNPLPIEDYSYDDKAKMFNLIHDGVVGAKYQFYDALTGRIDYHDFSFLDDVAANYLDQARQPTIPQGLEFDEVNIANSTSRVISRVTSSGAYNNGMESRKTIDEENNIANYKKRLTAYAMKKHLQESGNITIRVKGSGFLSPGAHKTIGNVYRILFFANRAVQENEIPIDKKKSGDYMVHSIKHVFGNERYDVHLTGCKLQHMKQDVVSVE